MAYFADQNKDADIGKGPEEKNIKRKDVRDYLRLLPKGHYSFDAFLNSVYESVLMSLDIDVEDLRSIVQLLISSGKRVRGNRTVKRRSDLFQKLQ